MRDMVEELRRAIERAQQEPGAEQRHIARLPEFRYLHCYVPLTGSSMRVQDGHNG